MKQEGNPIIIRDAILLIDSVNFETIAERIEARRIMIGLSEANCIFDPKMGKSLKEFSICKHYSIKE